MLPIQYITINQDLRYKEEIYHIGYPRHKDQNKYWFGFYKTKKPDPIFIFVDRITKIGECTLEIGEEFKEYEDKKVKIIMKFGGTFIDVIAIHEKSGRLVKTTLIFG